MDERAAQQVARRRNIELGDQGASDSYYIEVEREPGDWVVELRREPQEQQSWQGRIVDAILNMPWP